MLAQTFATKCVADYGTDQKPQSPSFDSVGRNFYIVSGLDSEKPVNYSAIINTWFGEYSNYIYKENICIGLSCGNYTQVCQ